MHLDGKTYYPSKIKKITKNVCINTAMYLTTFN